MKKIVIKTNWLIRAIKSGNLSIQDVPFRSYEEKSRISEIVKKIQPFWKEDAKSILPNMIIMSKSYEEAMFKSAYSFAKSNISDNSIYDSLGCIYHPKCNIYEVYVFKKDHIILMFIIDDYICCIEFVHNTKFCFVMNDDTDIYSNFVSNCILHTLFEKYAEIETKEISPGKKMQTNKGKLKNESIAPFKFRTTRYFTSYARDEDFRVRGHMRLQPCKDKYGDWTHKLIYINEFMKHGYHRKAELEKNAA